jgi:hypothetical protein
LSGEILSRIFYLPDFPALTGIFVSFAQQEMCKAQNFAVSSGLFTPLACRLPFRY